MTKSHLLKPMICGDRYIRSCISVELFVNGTRLKMTMDTGTTVTISMAKAITTLEALIFQVKT